MFQVVPSIDLRAGNVVRLQQGDYGRQLNYDLDPLGTARSFEQAGAEWMHIVDLDGTKQGAVVQADLIAEIIASCKLKVQVGGGVRSKSDVQRLLAAGAARVVVGTKAIEDWNWFESLLGDPALAGKIVLALDAREGRVATRGWTQTSERLAVDVARQVSDWPLGGILYTDVARDGMLQGPNVTQTTLLAKAGRVPVIASGGVGIIGHIKSLLALSIWGVIVGRSLHEGKLDLKEAIALARASEPSAS
ncbi:MAG TPA: 1-(5-phosphoribosyl)-5-[(5-phosphoribosylamino)methylideneamino]imidazole-4-carboxamide isomerase [Tepidisphaeraceae bacterium]|jgi:phosphoribosylformimino-5-aminoimidazole carboxamide ribotide isomerase